MVRLCCRDSQLCWKEAPLQFLPAVTPPGPRDEDELGGEVGTRVEAISTWPQGGLPGSVQSEARGRGPQGGTARPCLVLSQKHKQNTLGGEPHTSQGGTGWLAERRLG